MKKVSVVIPCYNSENIIIPVVEEIVSVLEHKLLYEVILVNDGTEGELWNQIVMLTEKYHGRIRGICLAKNFGQHSALVAGFAIAKGDFIIQMDDDGSCDPNGIFLLLDKIEQGFDVVYSRCPEEDKQKWRIVGSEINRRMCISLIGMPKEIHPTSFVVYRRFVVKEMLRYDMPYPYIGGLTIRATSRMCDVEIARRGRIQGKSNYTLKKLLKLWINGVTAFSIKPLEISAIAGGVFFVIGVTIVIFLVAKRAMGNDYLLGWSSLVAITLFLDGFILLMLGVLGEYIGRMYMGLNKAPQYVIREECGRSTLVDK